MDEMVERVARAISACSHGGDVAIDGLDLEIARTQFAIGNRDGR